MRGDVEQALQLIQGASPAALDKALGYYRTQSSPSA